jgi:hypothetical protein
MGLFSAAVAAVAAPVAAPAALLAGKGVDDKVKGVVSKLPIVGGLFSKSGGPKTFDFESQLTDFKADIAKVRERRDAPVDKIRKSAQVEVDELSRQRQLGIDRLGDARGGRFAELAQRGGIFGGIGSGGSERLLRDVGRTGELAEQKMRSDVIGMQSGIRSGDLSAQERFKDQLLLETPSLSQALSTLRLKGGAANMRARALHDAQKAAGKQGLMSMAGAGAGFAMGGLPGAMIGSGVGGGLFGSLA